MPVKKSRNGERSVEAEAEVLGSPEEVWQAIATGKGISSWFVPSKVEEREGGTTVTSFGPEMDAVARITKWNPPHSYTAETEDTGEAPGAIATEWIVEAREGGRCVVRVVHRWFADSDDWDGQFEGHAYGWATSFFLMLRLYLTHFPGQKCSAFQLSAFSNKPALATWRAINSGLNINEKNGQVTSTAGTPELAGMLERVEITDPEYLRIRETSPQVVAALDGMEGDEPEMFLRLHHPCAGLTHFFIVPMGEQTMVSMRFHFFGDSSVAVAAAAEREWADWLASQFPQEG